MSFLLAILIATYALLYVRRGVFDSVRRSCVAVGGVCTGFAVCSFVFGAPVFVAGAISS